MLLYPKKMFSAVSLQAICVLSGCAALSTVLLPAMKLYPNFSLCGFHVKPPVYNSCPCP